MEDLTRRHSVTGLTFVFERQLVRILAAVPFILEDYWLSCFLDKSCYNKLEIEHGSGQFTLHDHPAFIL
jgi:hypothetical protein